MTAVSVSARLVNFSILSLRLARLYSFFGAIPSLYSIPLSSLLLVTPTIRPKSFPHLILFRCLLQQLQLLFLSANGAAALPPQLFPVHSIFN